jgi:GNAT superfamily N-acetyltransferase
MAATMPRQRRSVKTPYDPAMPLTASTTLAARIDRAELSLVLGLADAMRAAGGDVHVWPVGGSSVVLGEANSPFNKLIALGFDGVIPEPDELERIERAHADRHARLQVELSTLADPAVGRLLTGRGYRLVGFENVLARPLEPFQASIRDGLSISEVTAADSALWITTVTDAFLAADVFDGPESHESFERSTLVRTYRYFAAAPGTSRLLARLDGEVAGGASLYLHDRTALLCGAATLPARRRRGVQSALLQTRLRLAYESGCDLAVVTTQPGSKSQENVQRAGFELIYSRAVLIKEP